MSGETGPEADASADPPLREHPSEPPRTPFDVGVLVGLGAAIASLGYVLLNAAYLEFYGSLGVSPESVGLDRLALLSRTAGLLLSSILIVIGIGLLGWLALLGLGRLGFTVPFGLLPIRFRLGDVAPPLWRFARLRYRRRLRVIAAVATLLVVAALTMWAVKIAGDRAEVVESGLPADPISLGPLQLVSIDADPARLQWLDESTRPPPVLNDPWLLYLGQTEKMVVFVACGQTVLVPASSVAPVILTTKSAASAYRGTSDDRQQWCDRDLGPPKNE